MCSGTQFTRERLQASATRGRDVAVAARKQAAGVQPALVALHETQGNDDDARRRLSQLLALDSGRQGTGFDCLRALT